jgi:hypothetical protein
MERATITLATMDSAEGQLQRQEQQRRPQNCRGTGRQGMMFGGEHE